MTRGLLKLLLIVAPIAGVVGLLRMCEAGAGDRWVDRVRAIDSGALLAIDRGELIVIAPSLERGVDVGEYALSFRRSLASEYGSILGTDVDRAMVVVVFSETRMVSAYAQKDSADAAMEHMQGYTDRLRNAIFLPPEVGRSVVRHELVHLLMELETDGRVEFSPWLSEGLAQYFEWFEPPEPVTISDERRAMLRSAVGPSGVDVVRLLEMDVYRDFLVDDVDRNYLDGLVLVAFLMETEGRGKMQELIRLERNARGSGLRRFLTVYGEPKRVADAVRKWLESK